MAAGPTAAAWIRRSDTKATEGLYDQAVQAEQAAYEAIRAMDGPVNPYELYQQMADVMTRNVTVVRYNDKLAETLQALETLAQDYAVSYTHLDVYKRQDEAHLERGRSCARGNARAIR